MLDLAYYICGPKSNHKHETNIMSHNHTLGDPNVLKHDKPPITAFHSHQTITHVSFENCYQFV